MPPPKSDPREKFIQGLELGESRVSFCGNPIVLLCGGKVSEKSHPDDEEVVASLRQKLSKTETAFEFFRPEEITDWHSDGVYKNLIDFEKDLAGICSLVLIVLESAGAIAELGAFSQIEDMKQKMMVISSSEIKEKNSFIELGVLRHLVDANSGSVRKYPWDMCEARGVFVSVEDEVVDDILSDVKDRKSVV